VKKSYPKK